MDTITELRKQIIDLQVLSLKKNCTKEAYDKIENDIRHRATDLLHSLDPSLSFAEHYSGPVICDHTGEFKANVAFISRLRLAVDRLGKSVADVDVVVNTRELRGNSAPTREISMRRRSSSPTIPTGTPKRFTSDLDAHIVPKAKRVPPKDAQSFWDGDAPHLERQNKKLTESISQLKHRICILKEELGIDDIEDQYKHTDLFLVRLQGITQRIDAQKETYKRLVALQRIIAGAIPELEREKDAMLTEACINATANLVPLTN